MIDTHTHTMYSADSQEIPERLIEAAINKGIKYLAITDHVDRDYLFSDRQTRQIVMEDYIPHIKCLKEKYQDRIYLAIGAEFGYAEPANNMYLDIHRLYPELDIIINSVHTVNGKDAYFVEFFRDIDKVSAYSSYLEAIKRSLDVPYQYDVVSHLGYITRNAPYPDKAMYYDEYRDRLDEILKTIVAKGKALEVNTRSLSHNSPFMPSLEIINRYKELGGVYLTFGSDAHQCHQVGNGYDKVKEYLKSIGYKYITSYIKHKPMMNEL